MRDQKYYSPILRCASLILVGVLFYGQNCNSAHTQWAKITLHNQLESDQFIMLQLSDFKLKWGHFYDCLDEKRKKLEFSVNHTISVEPGETVHLCSTGAKLSPTGVNGELQLSATLKEAPEDYEQLQDINAEIFRALIKWDSPVTKQRNTFNVTRSITNDNRLKLKCSDEFNKKGGALGNVECSFSGRIREKIPPPPPPVVIKQEEEKVEVKQSTPDHLTQSPEKSDESTNKTRTIVGNQDPFGFVLSIWHVLALFIVIACGHLGNLYIKKKNKQNEGELECDGCKHGHHAEDSQTSQSGETYKPNQRPYRSKSVNQSQLKKKSEVESINSSQITNNPQDETEGGETQNPTFRVSSKKEQ